VCVHVGRVRYERASHQTLEQPACTTPRPNTSRVAMLLLMMMMMRRRRHSLAVEQRVGLHREPHQLPTGEVVGRVRQLGHVDCVPAAGGAAGALGVRAGGGERGGVEKRGRKGPGADADGQRL